MLMSLLFHTLWGCYERYSSMACQLSIRDRWNNGPHNYSGRFLDPDFIHPHESLPSKPHMNHSLPPFFASIWTSLVAAHRFTAMANLKICVYVF